MRWSVGLSLAIVTTQAVADEQTLLLASHFIHNSGYNLAQTRIVMVPEYQTSKWTVSKNFVWSTRPVKALDSDKEVGRAMVGAPCGEYVRDSTWGREWRIVEDGRVLCSETTKPEGRIFITSFHRPTKMFTCAAFRTSILGAFNDVPTDPSFFGYWLTKRLENKKAPLRESDKAICNEVAGIDVF